MVGGAEARWIDIKRVGDASTICDIRPTCGAAEAQISQIWYWKTYMNAPVHVFSLSALSSLITDGVILAQ
jgi:hypothetical protein